MDNATLTRLAIDQRRLRQQPGDPGAIHVRRRQPVAAAQMGRAAAGHQELRAGGRRPRRAGRHVPPLGRVRHSGGRSRDRRGGKPSVRRRSTTSNKPGYGGPCPPKGHGPHHYHFKLFALDVERLNLSSPKIADLENEALGHAVGRGRADRPVRAEVSCNTGDRRALDRNRLARSSKLPLPCGVERACQRCHRGETTWHIR